MLTEAEETLIEFEKELRHYQDESEQIRIKIKPILDEMGNLNSLSDRYEELREELETLELNLEYSWEREEAAKATIEHIKFDIENEEIQRARRGGR